jgi:predicted DNA-binding transcriptional regulator AlpA
MSAISWVNMTCMTGSHDKAHNVAPQLVLMKYAIERLGWTRQTIYRKCAEGFVPFTRTESGYFIFKKADVDALAKKLGRA